MLLWRHRTDLNPDLKESDGIRKVFFVKPAYGVRVEEDAETPEHMLDYTLDHTLDFLVASYAPRCFW